MESVRGSWLDRDRVVMIRSWSQGFPKVKTSRLGRSDKAARLLSWGLSERSKWSPFGADRRT